MASQNPLTLAADNNPRLLPLLRATPSLASTQDEHGYSTLHAAASYNHLDLLKTLVVEFHVNVNVQDEDGETPLFVVESVEAAQLLIEKLGADPAIRNEEGETAENKILAEGEHPTVAAFLKASRLQNDGQVHEQTENESNSPAGGLLSQNHPPPLPPNVTLDLGIVDEDHSLEPQLEADSDFRRRIEELAAREDFQGEEGQKQLRELVKDAVRSTGTENRDVRRRIQ